VQRVGLGVDPEQPPGDEGVEREDSGSHGQPEHDVEQGPHGRLMIATNRALVKRERSPPAAERNHGIS